MNWHPHVTVATIVEQDGRFLFVEEHADQGLVLNQPAGHWERHETLVAAAARETLEETGYHVLPQALVGIYTWPHPRRNVTYVRFAFAATVIAHDAERPLDAGIVRALWLSPAALRVHATPPRSPLVWRCIEDYLARRRHALDLVAHLG